MQMEEAMWGQGEKVGIHKPEREALPENSSKNTLILDYYPPEVWENKSLLFKLHTLWYFVMAGWED